MKHIKKLAALVLALAMVLIVSAVAMADPTDPSVPTSIGNDKYEYTFTKEIKAVGEGTIYAPLVSYSYRLVGSAETIEGSSTSKAPAITFTTVDFANTIKATNGNALTSTGTMTINAANATAGIYKYRVDEECDNKATVGITENTANYNNTRYIIVVVDNTKTVTNVYLYTEDTHEQAPSYKTTGWLINADTYDVYETVKVTIQKVITGTYADFTHEFPFVFSVVCSNSSLVTLDGADAGTAMNTSMNKALANGDTAVITGVPKNATATVTVSETNNTLNTYNVTTAGLAEDLSSDPMAKNVSKGGTTANIIADKTITFTNALEGISPTGLVLRVAPYALAVAGGVAFFVISRRRNEDVA